MAVITTSLVGVKIGIAESDIAQVRQRLTEVKTNLTSCISQLNEMPAKFKDIIDTTGQVGYVGTNADCATKKALWDALVTEFQLLKTQATNVQTAVNGVTAGF